MRMIQTSEIKSFLVFTVLVFSLVGCAFNTGSDQSSDAARNEMCTLFTNITYSRKDTKETIKQVVGYNAARDSYCK